MELNFIQSGFENLGLVYTLKTHPDDLLGVIKWGIIYRELQLPRSLLLSEKYPLIEYYVRKMSAKNAYPCAGSRWYILTVHLSRIV